MGAPHRPKQLYFYMIHQPFPPAFVVDISRVGARKTAALAAYTSQFATNAVPGVAAQMQIAISQSGILRALEACAVWFGTLINVAYGEAYATLGPLGLHTLPGLDNEAPELGALPAYSAYL